MNDHQLYLNRFRHDFGKSSLQEAALKSDPLKQFESWLIEALESGEAEAHAMVLSTVSENGRPSARVLLLRNFSENGFVFYTNYMSKKASDLKVHDEAAMTFFWPRAERQVRIEGCVVKQSPEESDNYFKLRPDSSKIGAWSSPQSQLITSRQFLDEQYEHYSREFAGKQIPRPEHWGGYCLQADYYEFWQGRPGRLHDRISYRQKTDKSWQAERLAP